MNYTIIVAVIAIVLLLMFARWLLKKRSIRARAAVSAYPAKCPSGAIAKLATPDLPSDSQLHVIHRLCPHNNVVQGFEVEKKDSLDEHLDLLTRKLAEKEGRLRLSKYKIREKQQEIDNLHALDHDLSSKYREIIENLRRDLSCNELECRKLQEQIEWVSRRRAELKTDVQIGHRLYGDLAAGIASNLSVNDRSRVTDKPLHCARCLRHRKEPLLPHATPVGSVVIKSSQRNSPENLSFVMQN